MFNLNRRTKRILITLILGCSFIGCDKNNRINNERPLDPWAFRSVLDKQPRMLTLALDSSFYVAYDLSRSVLYKAWKGGVLLDGAAYTDKKDVQPSTWGTAYYSDDFQQFRWRAESNGKNELSKVLNRGYVFRNNQIYLKFEMILFSGDTIFIEERPEFIRNENSKPGLERLFTTANVPDDVTVSMKTRDTVLKLNGNSKTLWVEHFDPLPEQFPPNSQDDYDHLGRYWMEKKDCFTCHELKINTVGPSFLDISERYRDNTDIVEELVRKVKEGGSGAWGSAVMNPHPDLAENEIELMLNYILALEAEDIKENQINQEGEREVSNHIGKDLKPGFGTSLIEVHPSFTLSTLHSSTFKPRVGALAFLPDGRLAVATWDSVGGVYLLDNIGTGDTSKITIKRIASGLAEPLGLEVVDGEIFVLQKHELTRLIDLDGDEIIDEYQAVCNSWGVTDDFHEFAFGLEYKEGYFYATLSLAMRLMPGEQQQPDRGRTIKIGRDGRYEWLNYGLRTPNGIGFGVDEEIFVTDNQGQWLPANKLIHVKKGDFHGMRWGRSDTLFEQPSMTPPAIWLPQDEIANSPSEPILIPEGPYKGQLLHGDITHGGIKRDFLEKINGEYQGVVFRFTQGLEAGVNRLSWGPDGALYIGEVGMVGGWSWKGKQYGLQRLEFNGRITFEMLAVRAIPEGFEIEFTEPIGARQEIINSDILIQQWWYLPTENYGGPKMDLEQLKVTDMIISEDRTKISLEIPNLNEENVIYFRLPEDLQSESGQLLWSSEAWYTLNNIPE